MLDLLNLRFYPKLILPIDVLITCTNLILIQNEIDTIREDRYRSSY